MRLLLLLLALAFSHRLAAQTTPSVRVQLRVAPTTRAFTCRYVFTLPATDTASVIQLNLNKHFGVANLASSAGLAQRRRVYYPALQDTVQQLTVRYPASSRRGRRVNFTYAGTLAASRANGSALEFSGHSVWLPFRPGREYELFDYALAVRVPASYQVRSSRPTQRTRPGHYAFAGRTSAIELTAIVAPQFWQAEASRGPALAVVKAGAPLTPTEAAILPKLQEISAFYNRTIGRQDSIARFTILLTGTKQDAFGLLDNAAVITYASPDFDVAQRGDLLILAHEISHKWWSYGSFHDENDWLNEAFATYSSMLYLQAIGDTAGYRQQVDKLAQTTAGTPPIIGFDRTKYEPGMYRRVIYNKGMTVLAALHHRVGTAQLYAILATTAARQVSTRAAFADVVGQVAGPETRDWLWAELRK
jgi:hypothetical protein